MSLFEKFFIALIAGTLIAMGITLSHAESRFSKVVDRTAASVVKIEVIAFDTDGVMKAWLGTGVLIDSMGHIVTCEHVVPRGTAIIKVHLYRSSETAITATVIRRDVKRDLALIQLVDYSTPTPSVALSTTPVMVGDEVVAIGMPYGLDWSVTTGIISALHRAGLAINLTQTDAAINPGNSGGPLFNLEGEVVGINESGYQGANSLGFAVSVVEIKKFLSIFYGLEQVNR